MESAGTAERFARAGLIGLRVLDAAEGRGRRFGGEADARWEGFRGHLHLGDRIELLLRDSAVTFGAAFAPARAYRLEAVAEDDPFGPQWPRLDRPTGRRLWAEAEGRDLAAGPAALLEAAAQALEVELKATMAVGPLSPATGLLVAGCNALAAAVAAFAGSASLAWSEQVLVVADEARERQLAGLAAVLLGAPAATSARFLRGATRMAAPPEATATAEEAVAAVRAAGVSNLDRALVAAEATAGQRRLVELVRSPLGLAGQT